MASLEDIGLEFAFDATVMVGEPLVLGATGVGVRRIVPITGGVVAGPAFNGVVLAGGADWQVMRDDGFTEIEARYTIKGEDGALIYVRNPGLRVAQADVIALLRDRLGAPCLDEPASVRRPRRASA
jgi:hypothetical protein